MPSAASWANLATTAGRSSLYVTPNQRDGVESTSHPASPYFIITSTAYGI